MSEKILANGANQGKNFSGGGMSQKGGENGGARWGGGLKFLAWPIFGVTLILGVWCYYLGLKIELEIYDESLFVLVPLFVLFGLLSLGVLFLGREAIGAKIALFFAAIKSGQKGVWGEILRWVFGLLFIFLAINFIMLIWLSLNYGYDSSSFGQNFVYFLGEILD